MMKQVLDAYVRVSRRGGREGDSYHSPDDQMSEIEEWIAGHPDVELGEVVREEDVSGKTPIDDRELGRLLRKVENGVSNGIIVMETDRFARDLLETLLAYKRIMAANGRLVGADPEDGVDTAEPGGYGRLVEKARQAEQYLDKVRRRWRRSTDRAIEQGKHIAQTPFGYARTDKVEPGYNSRNELIRDGRLVPDPGTAPLVLRAFQMRASGASHLDVAKEIGRKKAATAAMLRNRIYLGEVRGQGGAVNTRAHDPIVSDELFAAVQARVGVRSPRSDRQRTYEPLLNGLVRCADCGCLLQVVNSTRAGGRLAPHYFCPSKSSNRACAGCAADAERVDDHVVSLLDLDDERIADLFNGAERAWQGAKEVVRAAEAELDQFVELAVGLDRERFQRGLSQRQDAVNMAKRNLYELDDPGLVDDLPVVDFGPGAVVLEGRGDNPERDRQRMRRVVGGVTVAKADRRRRHQPIDERVSVRWVGEDASPK